MLLLAACKGTAPDPERDDIPTKGDILVVADKDLERIIESQRYVFESIYADARVRVRYMPEVALRKAMQNDSVRVVFTATLPGADEVAFFRSRNLYPDDVPILTDGIAVLKAPGAPSDSVSVDQLRSILSGTTAGRILVDDLQGGVLRFVVDSLLAGRADVLKNVQVVESRDSLITRLSADPDAIGLISFIHISDLDDPACRALRERFTLCRVSAGGRAVLPNQSYLADGQYPLPQALRGVERGENRSWHRFCFLCGRP
ncbi:MAG TPA: substrate-binding domain-containing protein [Flavobacteriales bacterium]|nr:substrate-binding domain-containing protein [Flavobacteriales bacterium]